MITQGVGDLLDANTDAVVNTVNCVGVMGKGIALQFKRRYPEVYAAYRDACKAGEVSIGRMFPVATGEIAGPSWVVNFPTKKHWRSPSRLEWVESGLEDLKRTISDLGIKSIAVPPLGAGNGGLDWGDVEPLIRSAFENDPTVDVVLYEPARVPRNVIPHRRQLDMTPSRALALSLIDQYSAARGSVDPVAQNGASHLEIQKLLYFASVIVPSPRMRFVQGKYGPYSEPVRHMLQTMEGQFIEGYGDGDDKVLALRQISPTSVGRAQLLDYFEDVSSTQVSDTVDQVLMVISGFESAYGLELLATTHWVMVKEGADRPEIATAAVRAWSERKGRIFTHSHISSALDHLRSTMPTS